MTHSEQFLCRILIDPILQQAITSLRFEHIRAVAAQHGYTLTAPDIDATLRRDPLLAAQIAELISGSELEFELDEAEMALIAGGVGFDLGGPGKGQ